MFTNYLMKIDKVVALDYFTMRYIPYQSRRCAVDEPEIVTYGRKHIRDFSPNEFKTSLTRAFKDRKADCIILDSNTRNQKFRAACAAWAIDKGWLYNDANVDDGQSKVSSFRLTEIGKHVLSINEAVKVEVQSESGASHDPAYVRVYERNKLVAEVIAKVELKQGADGGYYNCVTFTEQKLPSM